MTSHSDGGQLFSDCDFNRTFPWPDFLLGIENNCNHISIEWTPPSCRSRPKVVVGLSKTAVFSREQTDFFLSQNNLDDAFGWNKNHFWSNEMVSFLYLRSSKVCHCKTRPFGLGFIFARASCVIGKSIRSIDIYNFIQVYFLCTILG